ncbi:hypothetical protein ABVK25_005638 [Lepraria finkii]|uniref:Uncharacterized protein n=1 Tax=Lepraria finkii TaxID=1340010 RepID=A0ABR4B8C7_9LECA
MGGNLEEIQHSGNAHRQMISTKACRPLPKPLIHRAQRPLSTVLTASIQITLISILTHHPSRMTLARATSSTSLISATVAGPTSSTSTLVLRRGG